MDIDTLVIIFVPLGALIFAIIIYSSWKKGKKDVGYSCHEIMVLLNVDKWGIDNLGAGDTGHSLYLEGTYKLRKIKCVYMFAWEDKLHVTSIPKNIPKKIPIFKLVKSYPLIYKNFTFDGNRVFTTIVMKKNKIISKEEANILLEDLIHACEMVERGEYEV